ncbi:MAG TPA: hypothetical protein VFB45_11255 [Pseudolabrys sp.]|nr:hypothetical protein [Pseudolabrys sp.]
MNSPQDLVERYVAVWNERDAQARRQAIAAVWRPDGAHFVKEREARGYAALEQRVIGSYEKNVRDKGNRFRARPGAQRLRDIVIFHWEMLPANAETVLAVGLEVLVLDAQDRVITDYQFILA